MKTTFGQRLKTFRKNSQFTQQELAEMIGVSNQAISKWETDTGMPDISQIVPLAHVLHVSTDALVGISDDHLDDEFERIMGNEKIQSQKKTYYVILFICDVHNRKI